MRCNWNNDWDQGPGICIRSDTESSRCRTSLQMLESRVLAYVVIDPPIDTLPTLCNQSIVQTLCPRKKHLICTAQNRIPKWYCRLILSCLSSRETTLPSDLLSILEEYNWEWHHSDGEECQQTRGPLITKLTVHLHTKKRERGCHASASHPMSMAEKKSKQRDRSTYRQNCFWQNYWQLTRTLHNGDMHRPGK